MLILLLVLQLSGSGPLSESDQATVQAAAVRHYLSQNPIRGEICLAVGGYKAPSKGLRLLLKGIRLEKDENCHFRKGGLVVSVTRALLLSNGLAELQVSKLEFDDVSSRGEGHTYKLERAYQSWRVVSEGDGVQ